MTLEQIKTAVEDGHTVYWGSKPYRVIKDSLGQWFIVCDINGHMIGLTWADGKKLNGKEEEFFIGGTK